MASDLARTTKAFAAATALAGTLLLASCQQPGQTRGTVRDADGVVRRPLAPMGGRGDGDAGGATVLTSAGVDLTQPGAVAWGTAQPTIIDTRTFPVQIQETASWAWPQRVGSHLPEADEEEIVVNPQGPANGLVPGGMLPETRTSTRTLFPTIGATGWTPPDPSIAVGPSHVLVTVNMSIAWYTKAGVQQFSAQLGSPGNPGFFEDVGAGTFTFDPKCFYDHIAQRFVVLALETYNNATEQSAWITIAVSDDSDPNGVWYKYRTDAVINVSGTTYWWDFPGLGYDQQAYYVTGNLFGLSASGYAGAGFRVFNKTPMLTGSAASYSTLRDGARYTVQPALHFGSNSAAYFADVENTTTMRIHAIRNPITSPSLSTTTVAIPSAPGSINPPTINGNPVSGADITMPYWVNGKLYVVQNSQQNGRNVAAWNEFATNSWPTSGSVTRTQGGMIDAGPYLHTVFPAIAANSVGDVGVVLGDSGENQRVNVAVAGRRQTDPTGAMGVPVVVKPGDHDGGGRWGDYQAICVDPTDNGLFWAVGEYLSSSGGWQNWVTSFRVDDDSPCHPVPDDLGAVQSRTPIVVDVLANDWHSAGLTMTISSFSVTSTQGGTVGRSIGTGPGGRDQLIYTAPTPRNAWDSFSYTTRDVNGQTGNTTVAVRLFDPATYRDPDSLPRQRAAMDAAYYSLSSPTQLPDFTTLTPYLRTSVPNLNYASTGGLFANSTLADNVGAVFDGYLLAPATDLYTLFISSDDGSRLYLGATLAIDNDGAHGMTEVGSSLIGLKAGLHHVRVEFFEGGGSCGLIASWQRYGQAKGVIPASAWFRPDSCNPDYNQDGSVDTSDVIDLANDIAAGTQSFPPNSSDFNADGSADFSDVLDLADVAAGAGCP